MKINTKALLAGTLVTALFAGTSAIAGDNSYLFEDANYASNSESVANQKVSYQSVLIETDNATEINR